MTRLFRLAVLPALLPLCCATVNEPERSFSVVTAPTVAMRDSEPAPGGPNGEAAARPQKRSATAGDVTTVNGRSIVVKVDPEGEAVTVTHYGPIPFVDDEDPTSIFRCDAIVDNATTLKESIARAHADQTICIQDGQYNDWDLNLEAYGAEGRPIVITALHPGSVVLHGRVHIALGGAYVTFRGLRIDGAQTAGDSLIELRSDTGHGPIACSNCRISEWIVSNVDIGVNVARRTTWLTVFGQENRIDHSIFLNKHNPGAMLVQWPAGDRPDNTLIDHNLFAHRTAVLDGGEAVRLGSAPAQRTDSFAIVQDNLFEDIQGGRDIVLSQMSATAFLSNTFRRCTGMLNLRRGDGDVVEENLFLTEHVANGGGIRVTDGHHRIVNNYIEGVRTTDDLTGGLVLMSADRGFTINGYPAVVHVLLAHNTIIDSQHSLVIGGGHNAAPPKFIQLLNNLFVDAVGPVLRALTGMPGSRIQNNVYSGDGLGQSDESGFVRMDPKLHRGSDRLVRPDETSPIVGMAESLADVPHDMDAQTRPDRRDIGADQVEGTWGSARPPLLREDVGPRTYSIPFL